VKLERFVNGRARSNTYVLATDDRRAIVVDAGVRAAPKVVRFVDEGALKPEAVLLTHGHHDHIWTAQRIAARYGIPVLIHRDDRAWFGDPIAAGAIRGLRVVGGAISRMRRMLPDQLELVEDGDERDLAGIEVRVLHTPGHSRGSVCLVAADVCFSGDTVFKGTVGQAIAAGGDRFQLRESIRHKLLSLPDELRVLPGHGSETTVEAERSRWERYVQRAA